MPCTFNAHKYPFGDYTCSFFAFVNAMHGHLDTDLLLVHKNYIERYNGNADLFEYRLDKIAVERESDITFHLSAQYSFHLLNTFMPALMIVFISYSTFFIPVEEFNERIMVSLTSLLVMAAFFNQAANNILRTPYLKLLDVWYVSVIAFCFAAVVLQVAVNRICRSRLTSDAASTSSRQRAEKMNRIGALVFAVAFVVFIVAFIVAAVV